MNRLTRLTPLTGLIFAALMVAGLAVGPTQPKPSSSGEQVIAFFAAHRSGQRAGAVAGTLALVFFIFFAGSLYDIMRRTSVSQTLGAVALVGAGLLAAGLMVSGSITWALTDGPARYSAASAHALNALGYDMILPAIAGLLVFGVTTGLAAIRGGWVPAWLGWVLIAFGILAPSPAFPIALFGTVAWSAVVAIMLVSRATRTATATAALSGASA